MTAPLTVTPGQAAYGAARLSHSPQWDELSDAVHARWERIAGAALKAAPKPRTPPIVFVPLLGKIS